jgi:hypothetical protein
MSKLRVSMLATVMATLFVVTASPSIAASDDGALKLVLAARSDDSCAGSGTACAEDRRGTNRSDRIAGKDSDDDDADDGADDKGVDGPGHDAGDDKGVDGPDHDAGDDHGVHGADHDSHDDHGGGSGGGSGGDD